MGSHVSKFNSIEFWLKLNTETKTMEQLIKDADCSEFTVRKYLEKFNLSYIKVLPETSFKSGRVDPNKGKRLKQFCPKGHDTFVTGRSPNSQCNVCKNEYYVKKGPRPSKQICKYGHDTFICGRDKTTGRCNDCKKERTHTYYDPEYKKKYKLEHKEQIEAQNKEYREKNKDKIFDRELRRKFGIGADSYNKLMELQKSKCLICKRHQSQFKKKFAVDHDHSCCPTSGKSCGKCIRGLLCTDCNILLGNAKENIETLQGAIDYLKKYKGERK